MCDSKHRNEAVIHWGKRAEHITSCFLVYRGTESRMTNSCENEPFIAGKQNNVSSGLLSKIKMDVNARLLDGCRFSFRREEANERIHRTFTDFINIAVR
jgi:hypothetical protein